MALTLDRVSFSYDDGPAILSEASLVIEPASYVLLRGPSGAGKSTLLRLLCRLEEPQSGSILLSGTPIEQIPPAELRRSVAYVQQMPTLLKDTVRENLLLPFSFKANASLKPPMDADLSAFMDRFLLKSVTLDSRADTLSVGQSQRICLIRSLLLHPTVILMDEPTASLDSKSANVVLGKAEELVRGGMTVVMISHSEDTPPGVTHVIHFNDRKLEYA